MPARMEVVPKVTFANLDKTVEFESGKLPYHEHGKPESILDVAMNFGHSAGARLRRQSAPAPPATSS